MSVGGRRVAVARLPHRAEHREPAPAGQQLHRDVGRRREGRHLGGRRHAIERRPVDVTAKGDVRGCRDDAAGGLRGARSHSSSSWDCSPRHARNRRSSSSSVSGKSARNCRCGSPSSPRVHSMTTWASTLSCSRGAADRVVVVAEHGHGALLDEVHDGRHRPFGIGAIADIVAEEHDPLARLACAPARDTR